MQQSLTRLPQTAEFKIGGIFITIKNHKVTNDYGLLSRIMDVIPDSKSDRNTLYQFEKNGISYEMGVECCAEELENNKDVLARFITRCTDFENHGIHISHQAILDFSKSDAGKMIAEQYIEKIRNCDDWGEFYEQIHLQSKFQKEMGCRIRDEIKYVLPESMMELPESADIKMGVYQVTIRGHRVAYYGLFDTIMEMIHDSDTDEDILYQFENSVISFETAIKYCSKEFKKDTWILAGVIFYLYDVQKHGESRIEFNARLNFSKSVNGRSIAKQYTEKIKSCENWGDLYRQMHHTSKFQKEMKNKIQGEMMIQCRKV